LSSPVAIVPASDGRIARIILSENLLVNRNGGVVAESTNRTSELEVDTMVFAIGDVHDPSLGLPFGPNGCVTNPDSTDPNGKYEVFDPATGKVLRSSYVVGWARRPSEGLVGIAATMVNPVQLMFLNTWRALNGGNRLRRRTSHFF
jgi:ferredoxin--NADP+ reductase